MTPQPTTPPARPCTWPACLTPAQQDELAAQVTAEEKGQHRPAMPDQRPICGCTEAPDPAARTITITVPTTPAPGRSHSVADGTYLHGGPREGCTLPGCRPEDVPAPECRASTSGTCLNQTYGDAPCVTEDGECIHGGIPTTPAPHACGNCEGIDPDTCLANPDRPKAFEETVLARLAPKAPQSPEDGPYQVWPLTRVLHNVAVGSGDWAWDEEWADLDQRHAATGYLDTLEQQIRENGITMPVLVGSDGRLWDGHHRLRIAVRLGIEYVPVEIVPPVPPAALSAEHALDVIAFAGEMCDIADREGTPVTTAVVRQWLKGPRPGQRVSFPPTAATAPAPVDPALRDRVARAIYDTYGQQDRDRSRRIAAAVLAELAPELAHAEQAGEMRALLADLTDPDPCWYDHHGYCQAHGWFATTPACPHARAKALTGPAEETP